MKNSDLKRLHKLSMANKKILKENKQVGCFYCCKIFDSSKINEWIKDEFGETALCPYCNIDSVLVFSLSAAFLQKQHILRKMNEYWFVTSKDE